MSHPQTLRIPFQEFGFFTLPSQELSLHPSSHTHILEENLLMTCKSHKKVVPLQRKVALSLSRIISRQIQKKKSKIVSIAIIYYHEEIYF